MFKAQIYELGTDFKEKRLASRKYSTIANLCYSMNKLADKRYGINNWHWIHDSSIFGGYIHGDGRYCLIAR